MTQTQQWLTSKEMMEKFRISRSTLFRMVDAGLPHIKIGGKTAEGRGQYRFQAESAEEWMMDEYWIEKQEDDS